MKMEVKYTYSEGYLPTKRHKILRYRDIEEVTTISIKEIKKEEAPIALRVHNYDGNIEDYRYWNNELWSIVMFQGKLYPIDEFLNSIKNRSYYSENKEEVKNEIYEYELKYIIIDDVVYQRRGEPRYVSMTFGLGRNHGGTSLMIDNYYNSNISSKCYFNALERDKAIEFTKTRAIVRKDTKDVDRIGKSYNIEVLIPESIKCNPQKDHDE